MWLKMAPIVQGLHGKIPHMPHLDYHHRFHLDLQIVLECRKSAIREW
jgi:hypothetical protein